MNNKLNELKKLVSFEEYVLPSVNPTLDYQEISLSLLEKDNETVYEVLSSFIAHRLVFKDLLDDYVAGKEIDMDLYAYLLKALHVYFYDAEEVINLSNNPDEWYLQRYKEVQKLIKNGDLKEEKYVGDLDGTNYISIFANTIISKILELKNINSRMNKIVFDYYESMSLLEKKAFNNKHLPIIKIIC